MKITVRGVEMAYDEQGEGLPVVFTNGDSPHTVAGDSPPRVWGTVTDLGGKTEGHYCRLSRSTF